MPKPVDVAALQAAQTFKVPVGVWPNEDWWKAYGDPELDSLIGEALKDSPTLKIAAARAHAAAAEAGAAEADMWPTVNASGSLLESEISRNQMGQVSRPAMPHGWHHAAQFMVGLNYEMDFFGKNRAALDAAISTAEAAKADKAIARLQLSTAVATTYAELARLDAERGLAQEALEQRRESADLVSKRHAMELENDGTLAMAEAQVSEALRQIAAIERLIASTRNQMAALLGKGPDRGRSIFVRRAPSGLGPASLPPHLALDLIGRRPDVAAARMRAEASASAIAVAKANFYPNVDLVGTFGMQSLDAKYVLTSASATGQFGPAISLPVFDYGRFAGEYRKSRAEYDAAVASYDVTLTDALRDVASAYAIHQSADVELKQARSTLASAETAAAAIRNRYKMGLASTIDLLAAQTQLIEQRRVATDLETDAFAADVALTRALGGGYAASSRNEAQE